MNILRAERINRRSKCALVKPWELGAVPDDFILAYEALDEASQPTAQRDPIFEQVRRSHPTYRKY